MRATLFVLVLTAPLGASATVINVSPTDDLRALLAAAKPGDEFVLAAGTYDQGSTRTAISVLATSVAPVSVRSASGSRAIISRAAGAQDVLIIENSSHVALLGLEIAGGNAGVRVDFSDDVTIEGCVIHGGNGHGVVADKTLGSAQQIADSNLVVRGNEIYEIGNGGIAGTGVSLGCNDAGNCSAPGALVELNYIHDLATGDIGGGIHLGASGFASVLDNVVHDVGGPGIALVGDCQDSQVLRNAVFRVDDMGIQVVRGVTVRNNLVVGATSYGLGTVAGTAAIGELTIANNTVVGVDGLLLTQPQSSVVVSNNALYATETAVEQTGAANAAFHSNFGTGTVTGATDAIADGGTVATAFMSVSTSGALLDAYPKTGGALIGSGDAAFQPIDDFNGTARGSSHDVGAYAFANGGNPGWPVSESFKTFPGQDDGGPTGSGSGGDSTGGDTVPSDLPAFGDGPTTGGAAKSQSGCVAALAIWPVMLGLGVYLSRSRRRA